MTDTEFSESMDNLIEKGLITIGLTKNGEFGFIATALGREVFKLMLSEEQVQ